MDADAVTAPRPSWQPWRCDGTALPPSWLLSAKLLALAIVPGRRLLAAGPPFLPFVTWLDAPLAHAWLQPLVIVAFYAGVAALLLNRAVRAASITIALAVLVHIAAHRLEYANNVLFPCVFLLLIGLYHPRTGLAPLRWQLALVYGGAALNKLLEPDWWSGRVVDTLMLEAFHLPWYAALSSRLPALGALLGGLTIVCETATAVAAACARDTRVVIGLMIAFHGGMLLLTGGQLSFAFLYLAVAIAPPFVTATNIDDRQAAVSPIMWGAVALVVRLLPRLLSHVPGVH